MKEYKITAEIEGTIEITVHAKSESEARELAEREILGGEVAVKWDEPGISGSVYFNGVDDVVASEDG